VFTQCSKCETIFKLSAEDLRAAGGQVRCGRCGEVFNALARLAEDANAFSTGESPLEMETRADQILHSALITMETIEPVEPVEPVEPMEPVEPVEPAVSTESADPTEQDSPEDFAAADVEFAHLLVLELSGDERRAPTDIVKSIKPGVTAEPAEPTDPTAPTAPAAPAPPAALATPATPAAPAAPAVSNDDDAQFQEAALEFTLPPGELDRIFVESRPRVPQAMAAARAAAPAPPRAIESIDEPPTGAGGPQVSEGVRREMLAGVEELALPEIAVRRRRDLPFAVWLCAAILLALCLGAQMIHENREWIATHAPLGSHLQSLYGRFGVAMPSAANLSAYQLRQWGVTGDPDANGTLRLRASILNTAGRTQPYPLLRVTFANRFGNRMGTRDFEPAEYIGKPVTRLLAPDERVDATLDILDPGNDAEGFEIDVCLRGIDQKTRCAADVAAQAKP
jgi:predicted Zn finger-like uncharacterized protein